MCVAPKKKRETVGFTEEGEGRKGRGRWKRGKEGEESESGDFLSGNFFSLLKKSEMCVFSW